MTCTLTITLERAESIDQFRDRSGQRRLHMHYWQLSDRGEWLYRWIERSTNAADLEKLIKKGRIYLMKEAYKEPTPSKG